MVSVLQKATTFYFTYLVGVTSADRRNFATDISEFMDFVASFNKSYENAADAEKHKVNFLKNKAIIQAKNAKHTKARFALDSFADLTEDEFLQQKTGARMRDDTLLHNNNANDGGNGRRL